MLRTSLKSSNDLSKNRGDVVKMGSNGEIGEMASAAKPMMAKATITRIKLDIYMCMMQRRGGGKTLTPSNGVAYVSWLSS